MDENGRELAQWLREAELKEMSEKQLKYRTFSRKTLILNYCVIYGVKLYLLSLYVNSFPRGVAVVHQAHAT